MRSTQPQQRYDIGMVGLGVMGRNVMLNMADHGFSVAGYDKDLATVEALRQESTERDVRDAANIQEHRTASPTECTARSQRVAQGQGASGMLASGGVPGVRARGAGPGG